MTTRDINDEDRKTVTPEQEQDGPKIISAETPEPRIIAVEDDEDSDDDPAEPRSPGDPDTDNEPENEPEGDGDNAPGEDAPADIQL